MADIMNYIFHVLLYECTAMATKPVVAMAKFFPQYQLTLML